MSPMYYKHPRQRSPFWRRWYLARVACAIFAAVALAALAVGVWRW